MPINGAMRIVLKSLSYGEVDVESSRHLANLKALDPLKLFYKKEDHVVFNGERLVPIRIYYPDAKSMAECASGTPSIPVLLFLHGGGWVTESLDTYDRVCARMSKDTNHLVVSVGYRLAPEHRFPEGLEDCYAAAKSLYTGELLPGTPAENITLIGDSAGGNLAAALSLMARDRGDFLPKRQILIYPAAGNDYTETSPFPSVHENGSGYLLTSQKLCSYMNLYQSSPSDRQNPYFAPLVASDLTRQPATLIITAEYDPLRDEGEAYGRRLMEAGNQVEIRRIEGALHGFFSLGIRYYHVRESFDIINDFIKEC